MTSFPAAIRHYEEPIRPIGILEFLQRPVCATQMIYTHRLHRLHRIHCLHRVQRVQYTRCVQNSEIPDHFVL